jgi:peptidoglycan/xylan/chitin deacetylase (PgdA/CDA1 family)
VKSHLTVAAPLLEKYDFNATFFITYAFMEDTVNFLSWKEIKKLDCLGFEIGNHSWTHPDFSQPENAARLAGELGLVNWELMNQGDNDF